MLVQKYSASNELYLNLSYLMNELIRDNIQQFDDLVEQENTLSLLKHPQKLKPLFSSYTKKFYSHFKAQDYDQCILLLNKALELIDVGKEALSDVNPYWKVCIYGNLACTYQKMWQIQRCKKYCDKVEAELEIFLKYQQKSEQILNLTKALIKIKFQKCAVLSQLNQHHKALEACRKIFPILQKYLLIIQQFINNKKVREKIEGTSDNIFFIQQVYEFAGEINKNLLKSVVSSINQVNPEKSSFYYWSKNPQKNQEQVIKKFLGNRENIIWKRSILGVTKNKNWINEFNIGSIMHITQFHLQDFIKKAPMEEYIFKDKIYESVIYCSLAHFTLATEMRFIQITKQKQEIKSVKNGKTGLKYINKKYGYQEKSQAYLTSEKHHIRSIDVIAKNIQFTIPYMAHLIRSYEKHYINNKPLEKIISLAQQSALSVTVQTQKSERHQNLDRQDAYYLFQETKGLQLEKKKKSTIHYHTQNIYQENDKKMDNFFQGGKTSQIILKAIEEKLGKRTKTKSCVKGKTKKQTTKKKTEKGKKLEFKSKSQKFINIREYQKSTGKHQYKEKQLEVKRKSMTQNLRSNIKNPEKKD